jgi:hypothetical protein
LQSNFSLDELTEHWEKKLGMMEDTNTTLDAFLDLSVYDMENAARAIDCPFCRRHMTLEAEEISKVLHDLRSEGNHTHSHGFRERMGTLFTSLEIVVNVLLGGLRRAGII